MQAHTTQGRPDGHQHHTGSHSGSGHTQPYGKLVLMIVLSFISMYILMYAMVDRLANVVPNYNQFYMAGLMTMPMVIIELLVMSAMYPDKRRNTLILAGSVVALLGFYALIRQQTAISDRQFVKSMIPHHAGAILMAKEARLTDPELQKLSQDIIQAQEKEIAQMKAKLQQLDK
ncbi:hypothetical protein FAES_pFAES01115 (plasmid) [Fibrella aestuarina BUZ 2]|uniref:DUF305 domain-containing protein n=1 Tax=Fibrella aestuarina BUZ 2 TaxID=1166018 RepID=I0KHK2_9BACT|nr:DUF305 domain-containing protein [Fibrella aestuarina]CCH03605.1 hypothetical protein FAES_pFAES01115 [Fibrella aestuarina BUZ 2]